MSYLQYMELRIRYQFSLFTLLGVIAGCGGLLALYRLRISFGAEHALPFVLVGAAALIVASFAASCKELRFVLMSWGACAAIVGLGLLHLASGYGWRLFGVWHVPGPPGPAVTAGFQFVNLCLGMVGLIYAVLGIRRSRPALKLLCIAPALILFGMQVFLLRALIHLL